VDVFGCCVKLGVLEHVLVLFFLNVGVVLVTVRVLRLIRIELIVYRGYII
jgi:hypothetical protein